MKGVHNPGPKARRRDARIESMLETASALVADHGLDALTLQRLATELGYVPAALYRYFSSKDALLAALQRRTIHALHEEMLGATLRTTEQAEALGLDARTRALLELVSMADLYLSLPARAPEHFRLISVLLADPRLLLSAEEARKTAPSLLSFLGDVRESLERARIAGALAEGDALDRTLVLWSALQGTAQLGKIRRFDAERFDPTRLGRITTRTLLAGWGAPRSALDRALTTADAGATKAPPRPGKRSAASRGAAERSTASRDHRSKGSRRRSETLEEVGSP